MENDKFQIDLPYVSMNDISENKSFGRILLFDYVGLESELTAIQQYTYQHFFMEGKYEDVAKALHEISIVEMKHFEILGKLIFKLGVDPKLRTEKDGKDIYWNGKYPQYSKSIKSILLDNIESEEAAIRNYKESIRKIDEPQIDAIIKRIILDEKLHLEIFTSLYLKYN